MTTPKQTEELVIEQAKNALEDFIYNATALSQLEDDGSHWAKITKTTLETGRAALRALKSSPKQKDEA